MSDLILFTKRFDFRCWKCEKTYSIFKEVRLDPEKESEQKIKVACPYCGESAVTDFFPHRSKKIFLLRNANAKGESFGAKEENDFSYEYNLPKILPTSQLPK